MLSMRQVAQEGLLESHLEEFERSGSASHAVEAFVLAWQAGLPTPPALQDWIGRAFEQLLKSGTHDKLALLLGLTGGRGKTPALAQTARRQRDRDSMTLMTALMSQGSTHGKLSREKAAETVCQYEKDRWGDARQVESLVSMHARGGTELVSARDKQRLLDPARVDQYIKARIKTPST